MVFLSSQAAELADAQASIDTLRREAAELREAASVQQEALKAAALQIAEAAADAASGRLREEQVRARAASELNGEGGGAAPPLSCIAPPFVPSTNAAPSFPSLVAAPICSLHPPSPPLLISSF